MNEKGQIISLDLIIALVLVIFSIGLVMGLAELRSYRLKDRISYTALEEAAEAGTVALSGGGLAGCESEGGARLPFSYDSQKRGAVTKEALGLKDYNVSLEIGGERIISEDLSGAQNVVSINISFAECNGTISGDVGSLPDTNAVLKVGK